MFLRIVLAFLSIFFLLVVYVKNIVRKFQMLSKIHVCIGNNLIKIQTEILFRLKW